MGLGEYQLGCWRVPLQKDSFSSNIKVTWVHEGHGVHRTHASIDPGYHFREAPSTKGAVDKSHSLREPLGH